MQSEHYAFVTFKDASYGDHGAMKPVACISEKEGLTLVVPATHATDLENTHTSLFACITLNVHSSLEAIGLTAAIATRLTEAGISANVIAGFYHDHVFVPVGQEHQALTALNSMRRGSAGDFTEDPGS